MGEGVPPKMADEPLRPPGAHKLRIGEPPRLGEGAEDVGVHVVGTPVPHVRQERVQHVEEPAERDGAAGAPLAGGGLGVLLEKRPQELLQLAVEAADLGPAAAEPPRGERQDQGGPGGRSCMGGLWPQEAVHGGSRCPEQRHLGGQGGRGAPVPKLVPQRQCQEPLGGVQPPRHRLPRPCQKLQRGGAVHAGPERLLGSVQGRVPGAAQEHGEGRPGSPQAEAVAAQHPHGGRPAASGDVLDTQGHSQGREQEEGRQEEEGLDHQQPRVFGVWGASVVALALVLEAHSALPALAGVRRLVALRAMDRHVAHGDEEVLELAAVGALAAIEALAGAAPAQQVLPGASALQVQGEVEDAAAARGNECTLARLAAPLREPHLVSLARVPGAVCYGQVAA
mmetsp:Transcript_37145/g.115567  ORF Transcript_37145/g.115567 Transcript_37145/m.115567 type:complete len:395 (+) Transcript_37145:324-1508(+)